MIQRKKALIVKRKRNTKQQIVRIFQEVDGGETLAPLTSTVDDPQPSTRLGRYDRLRVVREPKPYRLDLKLVSTLNQLHQFTFNKPA
jgi:hypothetical protein